MSAKDIYHEQVKIALQKDGWIITDDPLYIKFGEISLQADLGAERVIAAIKGTEKIAIEIKSFLSNSLINEFHAAMGQYINYKTLLEEKESDRILYLAVPEKIYHKFLNYLIFQFLIQKNSLKMMVFDHEEEVIKKWIN